MILRRGAVLVGFVLALAGCSARPRPVPAVANGATPAPTPVTSAPTTASAGGSTAPAATKPEPLLLITDPGVLAALEARGVTLARWFGIAESGRKDNGALAGTVGYQSIASELEREVRAHAARDAQAGVGVHRYSHRLFDARWLASAAAHFELVAVVNRFDRMPFRAPSCGETRLVYRLAYKTKVGEHTVASRLPMTLALELQAPPGEGGCIGTARRFQPPEPLAGDALAGFLVGPHGPLAPELVDPARVPHQVAVNLQLVRWPSTVRPDLGGHAEYLMLAFQRDAAAATYAAGPLENTPDGDRLQRDPALRRALLAHLAEPRTLRALDEGTLVLPKTFLATRAISVTPRGLSRQANRPFSALFDDKELGALPLEPGKALRSLAGVRRRLDALSCQGCHEARSIAGFHLLGDDADDVALGTALASGTSPHLAGDLERRARVLRELFAGKTPDFSQGFPERSTDGGFGAHCGLGDDPTFAGWTCEPGLVCKSYDAPRGDAVGQCLPATPSAAGDPCETGPLTTAADGTRERVANVVKEACGDHAVCNRNAVGFPGGMCTETCGALSPSSACGSIAVLEPFNACVARGEPFFDCLKNHARPAGLRACSTDDPCRDDYVCVRSERGGACIPPYFLFQLRVDGHP